MSPIVIVNPHYCSLEPLKRRYILMTEMKLIPNVGRKSILDYLS